MPNNPLVERPEMPATITRKNSRGLIEILDATTGRILAVQSTERDLLESKWDRLTRIDTPEGPVFIEKGLNLDYARVLRAVPYSKLLADLLCQKVVEGMSLVEAAKEFNLEYADVVRWRRENKEFREALDEARRDRAEYHYDQALKTAKNSLDSKLKVATSQWAAEKDDPERFGTKTKIVGDKNAPVSFIIQSAIQRPGDPGYNPPPAEAAPKDVTPVATSEDPLDQY